MKRSTLIISVVIVVATLAAIFLGLRQMTAGASTVTARAQTTTVQRGNLVASVSAAGNVSAPISAAVAFQTTGRVAQVNVQVGDKVKAGQTLMALDTTDLQLALKTAQTNLASAQANLDSTKANVQFALRTAQANLATSQANLESAKAKVAQNPNQLIAAKAALDKATVALQKAQSDYNAIAWRSDIGMTSQAVTLQNATIDYQTALANYNVTASNLNNDTTLQQAQSQLASNQVALEQAQKNLDTTTRTAQAQVDNAQVALDQAQRNLDKAKIVAPFDGLVSAVNFNVGDSAGSGTAITVVDTSQLQVKVTIAEVDISKIKAGQVAQMTLDALSGQTYTATVQAIGPVATVTQGVVNYPVTVAIKNNDGQIKPGMTANLAITVEQRNNVLLAPLRAVRAQGNQKTVTVQYKDQTISVPVTTGLSNDTSVEITSPAIQEGDVLVLQQTTTATTNRGVGGFPGGGAVFRGD